MTVDLTNLRKESRQNGLNRSELDDDPFKQFSLWFSQVIKLDIVEPSAMSLATADENEIGIRTVLLKHFDEKGFVFFTNYGSKKSQQIEEKLRLGPLFPWWYLIGQVKLLVT